MTQDAKAIKDGLLAQQERLAKESAAAAHQTGTFVTILGAGGIAFGAGADATTVDVAGAAATGVDWGPVIAGIVIALVVHVLKATARPVANAATAGVAAPVVSTVEDVTSLTVTALAILMPVLAVIVVLVLLVCGVALAVRARRRRARRAV